MKYWIFENFWKLGGGAIKWRGQLNEEYGIQYFFDLINERYFEIFNIYIWLYFDYKK